MLNDAEKLFARGNALCLKSFFLSFVFIAIAGCSSHPQISNLEPHAVEGKAVVYHYRKSQFAGGGRNFHVTNNKNPVFILENGSFYRELVEPGKTTYHCKSLQKHIVGFVAYSVVSNAFEDYRERLAFDAEAGKVYFVDWTGKTEFRDESIALMDIDGLSDLTEN